MGSRMFKTKPPGHNSSDRASHHADWPAEFLLVLGVGKERAERAVGVERGRQREKLHSSSGRKGEESPVLGTMREQRQSHEKLRRRLFVTCT